MLNKCLFSAACCLSFFAVQALAGVTVTTVAGSAISGSIDGKGSAAKFYAPSGLALDASGNLFVADAYNNKIRKITSDGTVTTFAGSGNAGSSDGNGTRASFGYPKGIAVDAGGNLFVGDTGGSNTLRKITPDGTVTTVTASSASSMSAKFRAPTAMVFDSSGNMFIADQIGNKISKITPDGMVTTFAGSGNTIHLDGNGTAASIYAPRGIAIDFANNIFVTDSNNKIRKITPSGIVTTVAGSGKAASTDGEGVTAGFSFPTGIAADSAGNLFVVDNDTGKIRKITSTGTVTTIAGAAHGSVDGDGATAGFSYPTAIAIDASGNLYVSESHKIRKIVMDSATNQAPTANFTSLPASASTPLVISFINSSTDTDGTLSYFWNFGDGTTSTEKSVNKIYAAAETYMVGLKVTDNGGLSAEKNVSVTVGAATTTTTTSCNSSVMAKVVKANQWHLLGASSDGCTISVLKQAGASYVYPFDTAKNNYSTDDVIAKGKGFWLKATKISSSTPLAAPSSADAASAQACNNAAIASAPTADVWYLLSPTGDGCTISALKSMGAKAVYPFDASANNYTATENLNKYEGFWCRGAGATTTSSGGVTTFTMPTTNVAACKTTLPTSGLTMYTGCTADSVSNFSMTIADKITAGKTCKVDYSNGTFTLIQGATTVMAELNGDSSDWISTLTTTTPPSLANVSASNKTSATTAATVSIALSSDGLITVVGGHTSIGGKYNNISCIGTRQ